MNKIVRTLFIAALVVVFIPGCAITSSGSGGIEFYIGVRVSQESAQPVKVEVHSDTWSELKGVLDDGKVSPDE